MKPKRKLKPWVKTALMLLPEILIVIILFFIAINLKRMDRSINVNINIPKNCDTSWSVHYE